LNFITKKPASDDAGATFPSLNFRRVFKAAAKEQLQLETEFTTRTYFVSSANR
jgi:hypothetical protein